MATRPLGPPLVVLGLAGIALAAACSPTVEPRVASRSRNAEDWLTRTRNSYRTGDFDDATEAARQALQAAPRDPEIREIYARVALTRLDYKEALRASEGLQTSDAHGIRGRAHWYNGDIEAAADELEVMLKDPKVKDPWARDVARLARQAGQGRHPFEVVNGVVAMVEMPRVVGESIVGPALVVPCNLDGEHILALVATSSSDVVIDSSTRHDPTWVSIGFGERLEVKDVPALTGDLSPFARQLGVPIKALLGVNFLRHTHATFDRRGDQFIVRQGDPSAPPDATRVPLHYVRGGGTAVRASVSTKEDDGFPLLVDSTRFITVAFDDATWKRTGIDTKTLAPVAGDIPNIRRGPLPVFKLGGFDLAKLPALQGLPLAELQQTLDIDIGGIVGAELLALFRVTFADEGRFAWFEPDPTLIQAPARPVAPPAPPASPDPPGPAVPPPSLPPVHSGGGLR